MSQDNFPTNRDHADIWTQHNSILEILFAICHAFNFGLSAIQPRCSMFPGPLHSAVWVSSVPVFANRDEMHRWNTQQGAITERKRNNSVMFGATREKPAELFLCAAAISELPFKGSNLLGRRRLGAKKHVIWAKALDGTLPVGHWMKNSL